ncbi:colicin immunity domain-containing protein [Nocardia stercoris]|nr:colicin immunity domain-containing protein [Nocardia stercoris]
MSTSAAVQQMLDRYEEVIRRFVTGETTADEFESDYRQLFANDPEKVESSEHQALEGLAAEVDDYISDPETRDQIGGLDGDALRACARATYRRLYG